MMHLLTNFINIMIHFLDKDNNYTETEHQQMCFGLQTLLYNVVVTSIILICALLVNVFPETLLLFILFGTIRILAGGYHFNSIPKCISVTALIMIGGGKSAQIIQINFFTCILLCLILSIIFFIHVPKGTKKNPYSYKYSQIQKKRLKIVSCILSLAAILSNPVQRSIIIFAMLIAAIFLLPEKFHKFQSIA